MINWSASAGSGRQAVNLLGDIGGFVAVFVAYVLAVTGRSPGPIPRTTAIITVLVTTVVLWVWRAKRLTQLKAEAAAPDPANAEQGGVTPKSPLPIVASLVRNSDDRRYAMSPMRCRFELGLLLALTIAATGWSASRVSAAIGEFATPRRPFEQDFICLPSMSGSAPRVIIADFADASTDFASLIEDRLYDALTADMDGSRIVCRWHQVIATRQEAQALGRQARAVLVVWGRSDVVFDAHLELASSQYWDIPGRDLPPLPAEELADFEFARLEPLRLSFLTDFVLSQVLYLDNRVESARALLTKALDRAESHGLAEGNGESLGEGYFQLGYLYDPGAFFPDPDAQRALAAYSRAIKLNPGLREARLNRGKLYASLGSVDLAIADYTALLQMRGKLSADAAVNRAFLQGDQSAAERDFALAIELDPLTGHFFRGTARQNLWNDLDGALEDFEAVAALEPPEYFYYAILGEAQLLAGRDAAAQETYRKLLPRLDAASLEDVIARLRELARGEPRVARGVDAIVTHLQTGRVP
jgi:tetratricopeptide (TPR) repeat protein